MAIMKTIILTTIVFLTSIVSLNAQEKESISPICLQYMSFEGGENYGLVDYFIKPNGIGGEFGLRTSFKQHANFNFGVNYAHELTSNKDVTALLVMSLGPSLRIQDQVKDIDRYGKADYKSKTTIDGYINPRFTIKYKMVVASVGYFYWARKFKFSKSDGAIGGVNLSLGCAF